MAMVRPNPGHPGFDAELATLRRAIASGEAMLLTGAGFSSNARSLTGEALPLGDELADRLWDLCFPAVPRDDSSLSDLFEHALGAHREGLDALLMKELAIAPRSLDDTHAAWFAAPWARIYTLNVDDLARAAQSRFRLPRPVRELSALAHDVTPPHPDVLDVIKLNGCIHDGGEGVTFATTQYGDRLVGRHAWYEMLIADLSVRPFVVVGSRLDEVPLWQHAETDSLGAASVRTTRPRSWIITPTLTLARRSLLASFNFQWIPATAEAIAETVLPHYLP